MTTPGRYPRYITTIALFLTIVSAAQAQYSGGTGEPNDPYQIATAENLMLLGETPEDYDKHFILTADIDLDPNLPGRKVFDRAVIAPDTNYTEDWFQGTSFTGVFDGDGHTISNLTVIGTNYLGLFGILSFGAEVRNIGVVDVNITSSGAHVGGLVGINEGAVTNCYSTGKICGDSYVGGLAGSNFKGIVTTCYSAGKVAGSYRVGGLVGGNAAAGCVKESYSTSAVSGTLQVGGLAGNNGSEYGTYPVVSDCYSNGAVSGISQVGGLIGCNYSLGSIIRSYSTGTVFGSEHVGGLVGSGGYGVLNSVWDVESSGLWHSPGGAGFTTAEMMDPDTLGLAGFADDPNWVLDPGRDYPRLVWEGTPGSMIQEPDIDWLEGQGVPEAPYRIDTADQLILLGKASILWDRHFILGADIDLDPSLPGRQVFDHAVIGTNERSAFTGVFDGNNHQISHLTINGESSLGLFGCLETRGQVKNLGVVDVNITGSEHAIGGLVGSNDGTVAKCYTTGIVNGTWTVGGLVGSNRGSVSDCHSTVMVSGTYYVGGLVGSSYGSVTRCWATASAQVAPWGEGVGGLVGSNGGDVIYCYSTGEVRGAAYALGGLVGTNQNDGQVAQCYSTVVVSGTGWYVGGLVGDNRDSTVTQCYSTGMVNNRGLYVGGLVGKVFGGSVVACLWDTQTSGLSTSAGGMGKPTEEMQKLQTYLEAGWDFVGEAGNGLHEAWQIPETDRYPVLAILNGYLPPQLRGSGTAEDPYLIDDARELGAMIHYSRSSYYRLSSSIDLSGIRWGLAVIPYFAGTFDGNGLTISHLTIEGGGYLGLFGRLDADAKVRSLGVVDVNVAGSDDYIGGLAGINVGSVIQSYSTGSVSGRSSVGGLLGYNCGTVIQCYSAGEAMGSEAVGGLVGDNDGDVTDCYSVGAVAGGDYVGGLIGQGWAAYCYSTGAVSGSGQHVGGLSGSGLPPGCFWNRETSGLPLSVDDAGRSTAEMQNVETYLDAGWSFSPHDIWFMPEGDGYPLLWWQLSPWPKLPTFSGGTGEPNDPYVISTAEQLNSIGHNSRLMERHFKLADDLDLAGRHFFVIGSPDYPYRGVFDGDGHTISHLTVTGEACLGLFGYVASEGEVRGLGVTDIEIFGSGDYVGGLVGQNGGRVIRCWSDGILNGRDSVGGLVGKNLVGGLVISCYSTGDVNGVGYQNRGSVSRENAGVGGLVGTDFGTVHQCYSTGSVGGTWLVGGLIGYERGDVTQCYSTGAVSGQHYVGGLVGHDWGAVTNCFWDTQTSGQTESAGGTGKTTSEMQLASTFLEAGWDFVDETENGTEDVWWINEGQDYPRLWWETE